MPDTFRWWDGLRWTQALSPRADAPPPPDPRPVVSEDTDAPYFAVPTQPAPARPAPSQAQPDEPAQPDEAGQPSAERLHGEHIEGDDKQPGEQPMAPAGAGQQGASSASGPEPAEGPTESPAAGSVPPPVGAPGPEYLPPPHQASERAEAAQAISANPEPGRENLRSVVVLATILVLLAGVATAAWIWWPRSKDDQLATPPPQAPASPTEPAPSPSLSSSPSPSPQNPSPSPSDDGEPSESARLVFEPLGGEWKKSPRLGLLSDGYAETQVTQADFDGRNDWIAVVTAGSAPPVAAGRSGLDRQAEAVASWFRGVGFAPMRVNVEEVDNEAVTVDGRPAHLLVQRVDYDNPSLRSRSDLVTVVVVDMGEQNPPGVFLASVPNTHQKLTVDVDNARRSLRIAE